MGWGDEIIATGLARGAAARGKRIAFGDKRHIIWSTQSHDIFKNNPNIAKPGSERDDDVEWIAHYGGHRLYGHYGQGKWHWNKFQCVPGEIFFTHEELEFNQKIGDIIIEPRVKADKVNKLWPLDHYQAVADELTDRGFSCSQLVPSSMKPLLRGVPVVWTSSFRRALAALSHAKLYVGPEGGLHHSAAAVGIRAVVIFGGFIGPETTGYLNHYNIAVGPACGAGSRCEHCQKILQSITVERVFSAALEQMSLIDVPRAAE